MKQAHLKEYIWFQQYCILNYVLIYFLSFFPHKWAQSRLKVIQKQWQKWQLKTTSKENR